MDELAFALIKHKPGYGELNTTEFHQAMDELEFALT
jgi:hypothetical protein